jgi:hypothetical protein
VAARDGSVYVLTTSPSGVAQIRDGKVTRYDNVIDGPPYVSKVDELWVGASGMLAHRTATGGVEQFGREHGLAAEWISAIAEDKQGMLLALASNVGLRRWDGAHVSEYRFKDGSPFTVPFFLATMYSAPDGVVWAGGFDGLWRLADGEVTRYTTPSGVTSMNHWYAEHP